VPIVGVVMTGATLVEGVAANLPEPLRLAHLIGAALVLGSSRGHA